MPGRTWTGSSCADCEGWRQAVWESWSKDENRGQVVISTDFCSDQLTLVGFCCFFGDGILASYIGIIS